MSITGDTLMLTWSDFRGVVPARANRSAFTSATFDVKTPFGFRVLRKGHRTVQTDFKLTGITVAVGLDRDQMWSLQASRSDALLKHEQGHYDLTALLMRDMERDLSALFASGRKFATQRELESAVDGAESPILSIHKQLQSLKDGQGNLVDGIYDQQTKDGTDAKVQAQWNAAFQACRSNPKSRLTDALTAQKVTI